MQIERRHFAGELRVEQSGAKTFLRGTAAVYDQMSESLPYRESLQPGCFDGVLAANPDTIHCVDHDPTRLLGKARSGTTKLTSTARGLQYRTELPNTSCARDLAELCRRGDAQYSSFAFSLEANVDDDWSEIPDPEDASKRCWLRTIKNIKVLHDVSTLTGLPPAYPGTSAAVSDRSLPESMPVELRNRILSRRAVDDDDACSCDCENCLDDDCDSCDPETCQDPENCRCMRSATGSSDGKTKRVDGEDLPQSAFLIHGDESDTSSWKLPVRFSTLAKSEKHVRLAIDLFSTLKDVSEDEKARAWKELEALAAKYKIEIDTDSDRAARARLLELAMIE
jgi:HK97 family phage prohead protease